jgi:hypothetical protein
MIARIIIAAVFLAIMGLVVKPFTHLVVDDFDFVGWLAAIVGIFWVGIVIENGDRRVQGQPAYSWYDAGCEVL